MRSRISSFKNGANSYLKKFRELFTHPVQLSTIQELAVRISQEQRLQKEMESVNSFVQGLLEELSVEREYRSQLFEEFKAKTLSEVHTLYKTQLETMAEEFSSSREQCKKLLELNCLLEVECRREEEKRKKEVVDHQMKIRQICQAHEQNLFELEKQNRLKSNCLEEEEKELLTAKSALALLNDRYPTEGGKPEQSTAEMCALEADCKALQTLLDTKDKQCQKLESSLEQVSQRLNLQNKVINELRQQLIDEENKSTETIERLYHKLEVKEVGIADLKSHYRGLLSRMKRLVVLEGKRSNSQHHSTAEPHSQ